MVDIVFMVSIFDLIESDEFIEICHKLKIQLDCHWLEEKYDSYPRGQGNVLLFQSKEDSGFLCLDLFQEQTDQNEMVKIGIRCKQSEKEELLKPIMSIYDNVIVKSLDVKVGIGLLNNDIDISHYPKVIPTITYIDEKEVYEYRQYLEIYE
ncbi:MAG: hypothetical protein RR428_04030 [Coprobacillus sp.]